MTPRKMVDINNALQELAGVPFPYKVARRLAALNKRVEAEMDTLIEMENSLLKKYGGKKTRGKINFPDAEAADAYVDEREKMLDEEDDVSLPTVDLSKYIGGFTISARALAALDGIIVFGESDDGE